MEHFIYIQKSTYPDPPHASPFEQFICKYCGESFYWQTCGCFPASNCSIDHFRNNIAKKEEIHLRQCPEFFKKLKTGEVEETLQFNLGFSKQGI